MNYFKMFFETFSILILLMALSCNTYLSENSRINKNPPPFGNIYISNHQFIPSVYTTGINTTVIWVNLDNTSHDVLGTNGPETFSSPPELHINDTYSHMFMLAGTYDYYCDWHLNMNGKIIVTN